MDLRFESNTELLKETKNLVTLLNEKTVEFLERLREIENRKLHLLRGYSSLFSFVTEELGFSAASAMRRINAMRLIKELPEVKVQISTGVLNLTTVSQTQQLFKKEDFSRKAKLDLLVTLENKSTRAVERELAKHSPEIIFADRMKPVSINQSEIRFLADDELVVKLEKLKALKSHSIQNLSELLNAMADLCLEKWEPRIKLVPKAKHRRKSEVKIRITSQPEFQSNSESNPITNPITDTKSDSDSNSKTNLDATFLNACDLRQKPTIQANSINKVITPLESRFFAPAPKRYISKKLKARIYLRDEGCCQYLDPISGKKCQSRHFLQLDHIKPFALGGETTEDNLRLYCSAHNQWRGLNTFGWSGSTLAKSSTSCSSTSLV